jgi:riboflavin synthase
MFTGIIQHVGRLLAARDGPGRRRLRIDLGPLADGLRSGDSVAVSGVCLTACAVGEGAGEFDVVAETLSRTTLGRLRNGARVNLERSLRVGEALEGHLVQGHVDGLAEVERVQRGDRWAVAFHAPAELTDQMVPKGSVAVDGVSLTLVEVADRQFRVALIPTTLRQTTLGGLNEGDKVNIEIDVIGKYVRRCLGRVPAAFRPRGVTLEKLREAGFL